MGILLVRVLMFLCFVCIVDCDAWLILFYCILCLRFVWDLCCCCLSFIVEFQGLFVSGISFLWFL